MDQLQFYANSFMQECGNMFDYNTQPFEQKNSFKANLIRLALPKPQTHLFYFIHKCIDVNQEKYILIQRSKTIRSHISKGKLDPTKYILLAGIKISSKINMKGKNQYYVNLLSAKQITTETQAKQLSLPYIVAKSFKNGYPLRKQQIIKLGRIQYEVVEIEQNPNKEQYFGSLGDHQVMVIEGVKSKEDQDAPRLTEQSNEFCRICYMGNQQNDILIHPCKCQSSIGSVHINCLKHWMNMRLSKMKGDDQNGGVYHTNLLFCQICQEKLPKVIQINGEMIPILNFLDDFKPYIGLAQKNMLLNFKRNQTKELVYIVMDQQKKASIGRLLDNGVIIEELTVSRKHAAIQFNQQNTFVLKDLNSKFGTLIHDAKAEIKLSRNMRVFQVKDTAISLKIVSSKP